MGVSLKGMQVVLEVEGQEANFPLYHKRKADPKKFKAEVARFTSLDEVIGYALFEGFEYGAFAGSKAGITFEGLHRQVSGVVFIHPDGRMIAMEEWKDYSMEHTSRSTRIRGYLDYPEYLIAMEGSGSNLGPSHEIQGFIARLKRIPIPA